MARIRTIKPEFWEDEKIAKLPMPCRLFYIGLWNFADDQGVFRGNPAILKSKIFPYDENLRISEISKWIDALVEARMLIPVSHNDESYYAVRTFGSHQKIDSRYTKFIVPQEVVGDALSRCEHVGDTSGTQREHGIGNGIVMEEEKEEDICRDEPRPQSLKSDFENFISDFNKLRGTKFQAIEKVRKNFNGRLKEGFTPAQMLQALEKAMKDKYHIDTGFQYLTPEFFTRADKIDKFLNQGTSHSNGSAPIEDWKKKLLNS